jgi:hypothetical protein
VDAGQLVPHGNGVVLDAPDMGVLQLGEVDINVAGSLLVCRAEALSSGIVVEADADVERLLIRGERDECAIFVPAGLEQLKRWRSVLLGDDAPNSELAQARGL